MGLGFKDIFKDLIQPADEEDDYFEEAEKPVQGYAVKPRPVAPTATEIEFENTFGSAAPSSTQAEDDFDGEDDDDMSGGLFGNFGKRAKKQQSASSAREQQTPSYSVDAQPAVFKPRSFDDGSQLIDYIKSGRSVAMSLEDVPTETARRLLDFFSGIVFALHWKITSFGQKAFLIIPDNADNGSAGRSGK